MTFISVQGYALSATKEELSKAGKQNFFCCAGSVGSCLLVDTLNEKLSAEVTTEPVIESLIYWIQREVSV